MRIAGERNLLNVFQWLMAALGVPEWDRGSVSAQIEKCTSPQLAFEKISMADDQALKHVLYKFGSRRMNVR